jgi:hypothetical protein
LAIIAPYVVAPFLFASSAILDERSPESARASAGNCRKYGFLFSIRPNKPKQELGLTLFFIGCSANPRAVLATNQMGRAFFKACTADECLLKGSMTKQRHTN